MLSSKGKLEDSKDIDCTQKYQRVCSPIVGNPDSEKLADWLITYSLANFNSLATNILPKKTTWGFAEECAVDCAEYILKWILDYHNSLIK